MIQVVCVKWGTKYTCYDVSRMYRAIKSYTKSDIRFVCVTDRLNDAYDPEIIVKPFPEFAASFDSLKKGCRLKLSIFKQGMLAEGVPTIFFDIDTVITGDVSRIVSELAKRPDHIYILQNHYLPTYRITKFLRPFIGKYYYFGNSSILAFYTEKFHQIFDEFNHEIAAVVGKRPKRLKSDERFISYSSRDRSWVFPRNIAVKFAEEFMLPFASLEDIRKRLPWVRKRRDNVVAITFVGKYLKPEILVNLKKGDLIEHKRQRVHWDHEAYSAYWRT